MGVLKRLPVIGKDLLEDTPVPRRGCTHQLAPSWGDTLLTMQRLYHASRVSSTPHQPVPWHPSPASFILELWGLLDRKNAFSYTIKKKDIENHKKWMVRCFGALFGSFFFWRIEALVLQWMFSSATGWLFYTLNTWLLGMLLFDYAARKSGFYGAQTPALDAALS